MRYLTLLSLLAATSLGACAVTPKPKNFASMYAITDVTLIDVLTIRDSVDEFAGSCQKLFIFSEGKITRHEEIVLHVGTGRGILYKPSDEWMLPVIQWADQ